MLKVKQVIDGQSQWSEEPLYLHKRNGVFSFHLCDSSAVISTYVPKACLNVTQVNRRGGGDLFDGIQMISKVILALIIIYGVYSSLKGWPENWTLQEFIGSLLVLATMLLTTRFILLQVFKNSEAIRLHYDADWPDVDENAEENISVDKSNEELLASYEFWPPDDAEGEAATFITEVEKQGTGKKLEGPPVIFYHEDVFSPSPIEEANFISTMLGLLVGVITLVNEFLNVVDPILVRQVALGTLIIVVVPVWVLNAWKRKEPMSALRRTVLKGYAEIDPVVLVDNIEQILAADPGNAALVSLLVDVLVREGEYQRAFDSLGSLDGSDQLRDELQSKIEKVQAWNSGVSFSTPSSSGIQP